MSTVERMESTVLEREDVRGVNLRGADLREADLRDADLRGALLDGARLDGAYSVAACEAAFACEREDLNYEIRDLRDELDEAIAERDASQRGRDDAIDARDAAIAERDAAERDVADDSDYSACVAAFVAAIPPGSVVYLASPYTHDDPAVVVQRYRVTRAATAAMLRAGVHVYSPIVHCHALAVAHDLPTDAAFWGAYNRAMLGRCDVLAVLTLDGHDTSRGVAGEVAYAREHGLMVLEVTP